MNLVYALPRAADAEQAVKFEGSGPSYSSIASCCGLDA